MHAPALHSGSARPRGGLAVMLVLLGSVMLIAVVDYASGMTVVVSTLYFVPIIAAGWLLLPRRAVAVAVVASAAWLAGDVVWRGSEMSPAARVGNAAAGVATLSATAFLVQRARRDQQALISAVRQLDLALARESETARRDALTGLPNARALSEELTRELARSRRSGVSLSLLYIDLDDFKEVNDRYGHAAGDALLRRIGSGIGSILRAGDLAARIGGDEFVVLLGGMSAESAREVASRIVRLVKQEASTYAEAGVGASVGVAHYSRTFPEGAGEMLGRADAAMYEAKHGGKGRVVAQVA